LETAKESFNNQNYVEALELTNKSLSLNLYYKEGYNLLGKIFNKINYFDSAVFYFKKAAELDSKYSENYYDLSLFYNEHDQSDSAYFYINSALKNEPSNLKFYSLLLEILLEKKNYPEFLKTYEYVSTIAPDFSILKYYYGCYLEQKGQNDAAINYYNESSNPINIKDEDFLKNFLPKPYLALANLYLKKDSNIYFDNIFYNLNQTLKYSGFNSKLYNTAKSLLTKFLTSNERYDEVIKLWDIKPIDFINNYHIGLSFYKKAIGFIKNGKNSAAYPLLEKSEIYFKNALNLNSDDEISQYMLEKIYLHLKLTTDKIRKEYSELHFNYANNYIYTYGKKMEGLFELNKSLRLFPENIKTHFLLAEYYKNKNCYVSAMEHLNLIQQIDSKNVKANDLYDYLKYREEKISEHLRDKNKLNKFKPNVYNIAVKIKTNLFSVYHSNLSRFVEEQFEYFKSVFNHFNFYFVPEQFSKLSDIETYSKTVDSDGILILDFNELRNSIKLNLTLYTIANIREKADFPFNKIRRSIDLKTFKTVFLKKGKQKFYNILFDTYKVLNDKFESAGTVAEFINDKAVVNLGLSHDLKKGDELNCFSKNPYDDKFIGKIKIVDLNEKFSLCDILDKKVLDYLKKNDVVIKKTIKNKL
jgi:tetratricopeptide (TPR) repeat protein